MSTSTPPTSKQAPAEYRTVEHLGVLSERQGKWIDRWFLRWFKPSNHDDWVTDAEWARINQQPLRARQLLRSIVVVFVILLLWSAFADIDEIARGDGKVIPSQKLQTIQSLDGGLVQAIYVREGQIIEAGDVLVKVDPTRFIASVAESRSQFLALSAEVSRLEALASGTEPQFSAEVTADTHLLVTEQRLYQSSVAELNEQQFGFDRQIEQRQQELAEANAAVTQYRTTLALTQRELDVTRPLLSSGAVSDIDILRLERDIARLQGELSRAIATKARTESAIEEARNRQRETRFTAINRWQNQLAESSSRLQAVINAEQGLSDKVVQADIRSPIRGTVQRLHVNTVGGVISPGRDVVDIIPLDDTLVIEARIHPKDIAFLKNGQRATIRFSAYDFSLYGGLIAKVSHISADTITDERDNTYYLVQLATEQRQIQQDLLIIPGMTAQVDIITGKRTVLSYLLKPLLRAKTNALTER